MSEVLVLPGYDDVEIGGGTRVALADGDHSVTITGVKIKRGTGKKSGKAYQALEVEYTNGQITEDEWISIPDGADEWAEWKHTRRSVFKSNLKAIGLEPKDLFDDMALMSVVDRPVLIHVKTNGEYRNVYFNAAKPTPPSMDEKQATDIGF